MDNKKVFDLALQVGEVMLKNGAETYRVEDTITRILQKTGCQVTHAFVTPTGIFATLDNPDMDCLTYVLRVEARTLHMHKIVLCNQLSREFCANQLTVLEASDRIKEITEKASYPSWLIVVATALASAAFATMFSGTLMDAVVAMCIGLIVGLLSLGLKSLEMSKFFIDIIVGFVIGCMGILLHKEFGLGQQFEAIIVGAIMPFVPGVAITNAIFDTIQGNLLSGISRAVEAFIVAATLAVGIGVVFSAYQLFLGGVL